MLNIGDEIILEISNLSSSGLGVGSYESDTRRTIFVNYAVPEDKLKVRITNQRKVYYEAEIVEILKESPYRIKPVCKHFGVCGACDYLHIKYDKQVDEKEKLLEFFFRKHDIVIPKIGIIKSKEKLFYRDKARITNGGFFAKKSNNIIKIEECFLLKKEYTNLILSGAAEGSYGFDYNTKTIVKDKALYNIGSNQFFYHPYGFVQNNLETNELMVQKISSSVKEKKLLDLYCGNGNFTIPLSSKFDNVHAVEGSRDSFNLLKENIKLNDIKNISVFNEDSKDFVKKEFFYDYILIDPPRAGAEDLLINIAKKTNNLIYVSCNPDTMVKEIKKLKAIHDFKIKEIILVDMFPQTKHFETIVFLEMNKK
jgi:23S rRNA (uracil1939-C5)-methyltransferase